jgi:hypothetical protein
MAYRHDVMLWLRETVDGWLQGGQLTPINLIVEERFHRAAPGGMGGIKAAGNYSPVGSCLHLAAFMGADPQLAQS